MSNLEMVIKHIENAEIAKAFEALDSLQITNTTLASLRKEFISGKSDFEFTDRFLTHVKSLKTGETQSSQDKNTTQFMVNQFGEKSISINKNEGGIHIH